MKDLAELYRWPDGYTMCRPTVQGKTWRQERRSFPVHENDWAGVEADLAWVFVLVGPQGRVFATWFLASEYGDQEPITKCRVTKDEFVRGRETPDADRRWAAFYLDLLVSRDRALAGDFLPDYYIYNRLPLFVSESSLELSSDKVREIEEISRAYTRLVFVDGKWVDASEQAEQVADQIKRIADQAGHPMMDFQVSDRYFSMRFDAFDSPDMWLLGDPEFKKPADWEWIVINEDDTVIGVGHTPLGALASAKQFVWPDSVATDLLPSLDAWMEKWTLQGTISQNLEMYKLLGLPTPAVMVHSQFLEWAKGMESGS